MRHDLISNNSQFLLSLRGKQKCFLFSDEYIGDSVALRATWTAYEQFKAENGPDVALPGLENYSHDQLFFIAYASQYCGMERDTVSYSMGIRGGHFLKNVSKVPKLFSKLISPSTVCRFSSFSPFLFSSFFSSPFSSFSKIWGATTTRLKTFHLYLCMTQRPKIDSRQRRLPSLGFFSSLNIDLL